MKKFTDILKWIGIALFAAFIVLFAIKFITDFSFLKPLGAGVAFNKALGFNALLGVQFMDLGYMFNALMIICTVFLVISVFTKKWSKLVFAILAILVFVLISLVLNMMAGVTQKPISFTFVLINGVYQFIYYIILKIAARREKKKAKA